jgi:hypothetical protein
MYVSSIALHCLAVGAVFVPTMQQWARREGCMH